MHEIGIQIHLQSLNVSRLAETCTYLRVFFGDGRFGVPWNSQSTLRTLPTLESAATMSHGTYQHYHAIFLYGDHLWTEPDIDLCLIKCFYLYSRYFYIPSEAFWFGVGVLFVWSRQSIMLKGPFRPLIWPWPDLWPLFFFSKFSLNETRWKVLVAAFTSRYGY